MELRHLRYFVALADELHFGRAAERLNIAPPTLTVQIQEIERALSAQLLVRARRRVSLTPAGEVFRTEALAVLDRFERAVVAGRRAGRGEIGSIEIGYVGSAAYAGVLSSLMVRFQATWPNVELRAREVEMAVLPDMIVDGRIDIGFVRMPMSLDAALRSHTLLEDRFCVAIPAGRADLLQRTTIEPRTLRTEAFIMPEQDAGTFEVARRGGFQAQIVSKPGSLLAVLTQVSLASGLSIVPSIVVGVLNLPGVAFRDLAGTPIPSKVAAVFRSREANASVQNFIEQLEGSMP